MYRSDETGVDVQSFDPNVPRLGTNGVGLDGKGISNDAEAR